MEQRCQQAADFVQKQFLSCFQQALLD